MVNGNDPSSSRLRPALLAARFLFPIGDDRRPDDPAWGQAGRWLAIWGLVIGLMYLVLFRVTWKWFGEYHGVRWLPAATVLTADLGFCGYRLLAGITQLSNRNRSEPHATTGSLTLPALVAVLLVTIVKYAMLLSLPVGRWNSPPTTDWYLPGWFQLLCPDEAIYRPLLLMPIWGRWAMALASSIGRMAPDAPGWLQSLASGLSLRTTFTYWTLATILTMAYSSLSIISGNVSISSGRSLAYGLLISMVVMLCAYLVSFVLARRGGGQTESTVYVAGLAAELAFLTVYLRLASIIYWY
jgi:hypothetical protein